ncbi:MAG TPA: TIM barrel protein [Actinopolymorphaceae bacterium]|jgi:xylose isomerase
MREFTAGMWVFGQIIDRYATDGYNPPVATLDVIAQAAATGELVGIDINYPWPEPDLSVADVKKALDEAGLQTVCVTPVIYNRQFRSGSFSHADPAVRKKATDLADESVDVARQLGARYVKFWPGQDGYDYPFQVDYRTLREHGIGGIRDVARNHPDTTFAIEYKLKEPRTRLLWSTAAATLVNIEQAGVDNLGVVIDFGHSLFAKENPAEALAMVHAAGRLVDIELDDNYREWDDDLTVGALHLVETLEFLYVVRQIGWSGPLKLDLFPYREDRIEAVRQSVASIRRLEECVDRLPIEELEEIQSRHDAMAAQALVRKALIG